MAKMITQIDRKIGNDTIIKFFWSKDKSRAHSGLTTSNEKDTDLNDSKSAYTNGGQLILRDWNDIRPCRNTSSMETRFTTAPKAGVLETKIKRAKAAITAPAAMNAVKILFGGGH
jgi:hypothetical protein